MSNNGKSRFGRHYAGQGTQPSVPGGSAPAPLANAAGDVLVAKARQVLARSAAVRPQRVAAIKTALAAATYRVDSQSLARSLYTAVILSGPQDQELLGSAALHLIPLLAEHPALLPEFLATQQGRPRDLKDYIHTLVYTLDARDQYSGKHCTRVTAVALKFARHLELSDQEMDTLKMGGVFHDIGKVMINDFILRKSGIYTPAERAAMETHPGCGGALAASLGLKPQEKEIIMLHHERWDGRGYPLGMAGEQIPFLCRLVALADVFDALTTDRPYRSRLPVVTALAQIQTLSGHQFDPRLTREFIRLMSTWPSDREAKRIHEPGRLAGDEVNFEVTRVPAKFFDA